MRITPAVRCLWNSSSKIAAANVSQSGGVGTKAQKLLDFYSQFNPSPLSIKQFIDFGEYIIHRRTCVRSRVIFYLFTYVCVVVAYFTMKC